MTQKTNKQRVLEYARRKGEITHADVIRDLGINTSSIGAALQGLTQDGALKVAGAESGKLRYRAAAPNAASALWKDLLYAGGRAQK